MAKNKTKFVEVLKLNQQNLERSQVVNVKEENITKSSKYNFLVKVLEAYNGRKFKDDERITEYIKINLSQNEEVAREQWFDGIEYEGNKYKAWFATVGGMKQEDNGICDTIFIREDYQEFAEMVEDIVSLGKFKELEQVEKDICINKDVLSRLSLTTSDLITEINMPNFIVLPSAYLDYIEDYKTVKPIKTIETNNEGEEVEKVDYELVDYHFDTNKRDENGNSVDEIECFDGFGIATPKVFEAIGKSLGRDDIEFSIIRGYGLAIKGLITKFDIIGYLDSTYKGDTSYCRRIDGQYELLDRWGDWRVVTDNTMLLNDSMVKLAKYFDGMEEYEEKLNNLNDKYKNLLNKLYITKVNKTDKELEDYRRTNYQLINVLALTPDSYYKLAEQDIKMFKKIVIPFDCRLSTTNTKEFIANTDYINLFFKNIANKKINEEDENYQERLKEAIDINITDKVNELINIDEDYVKLEFVKRNLGYLVEKKIRELASGKVTVEGKYQYMACCPISYMNFAMYREQGNNGLAKGQFYSGDCEDGDIRTISRNPLAAYSEVHNVEFVRNEYLDKWLSPCRELIYFNQKSDIQNLLSSADFDGDGLLAIDNDIIKNAVVIPKDGKYFITLMDGAQKKLTYNKENRFLSTYLASGNLIGKIALKAASVNCNCQRVPDFYDTVNSNFILYKDLKEEFETNGKTKEELDTYIKEKLNNGEYLYGNQADTELKARMIESFYEYEKEIYIILYNSMKSIDATKTLVFPSKADMEVIDQKYFKKPCFLAYKENKEDVVVKEYVWTSSMMDRFARTVQRDLLDTIENRTTSFRDRAEIIQSKFKNDGYSKEIYDDCNIEINNIYKEYTKDRKEIRKIYNSKMVELREYERYFKEVVKSWQWYDDDYIEQKTEEAIEIRNKQYKELNKKYIPICYHVTKTFDLATICQCISKLPKCTENFILTLFWKCFEYANKPENIRYIYQENEDGDIEFLHRKYKKIAVSGYKNNRVVEKIGTEDLVRAEIGQKVRFKMFDDSIIDEIKKYIGNGQAYELDLADKRIEIFEEFEDVIANKENIKIIKFDTKKNGELSVAKKSFGVLIEQ